MIKTEYNNIIAFHPGFYIKDFIEEHDMTQKEFAVRIGSSPKIIKNLINGRADLSNDIAEKISAISGISIETLLNLQKNYDSKILEIERNKKCRK